MDLVWTPALTLGGSQPPVTLVSEDPLVLLASASTHMHSFVYLFVCFYHYVAMPTCIYRDPPASASGVLRLKVCATRPGKPLYGLMDSGPRACKASTLLTKNYYPSPPSVPGT